MIEVKANKKHGGVSVDENTETWPSNSRYEQWNP